MQALRCLEASQGGHLPCPSATQNFCGRPSSKAQQPLSKLQPWPAIQEGAIGAGATKPLADAVAHGQPTPSVYCLSLLTSLTNSYVDCRMLRQPRRQSAKDAADQQSSERDVKSSQKQGMSLSCKRRNLPCYSVRAASGLADCTQRSTKLTGVRALLCTCRVPKLDEFIITLANIARAQHIREAVGQGSVPSSGAIVDGEASARRSTADAHAASAAHHDAASATPLTAARLPGGSMDTPAYSKRLGRPPITPGTANAHLLC